jgi:hypothetical protein
MGGHLATFQPMVDMFDSEHFVFAGRDPEKIGEPTEIGSTVPSSSDKTPTVQIRVISISGARRQRSGRCGAGSFASHPGALAQTGSPPPGRGA